MKLGLQRFRYFSYRYDLNTVPRDIIAVGISMKKQSRKPLTNANVILYITPLNTYLDIR